jgi:hypothetical protein
MSDHVKPRGSPKPNSASDAPVKHLPYASIGENLPGQIEIKEDRRRGRLIVEILRPIVIGLRQPPFRWLRWLARIAASFLGGAAGAIFFLWLRMQPGFQRFLEGLPFAWP